MSDLSESTSTVVMISELYDCNIEKSISDILSVDIQPTSPSIPKLNTGLDHASSSSKCNLSSKLTARRPKKSPNNRLSSSSSAKRETHRLTKNLALLKARTSGSISKAPRCESSSPSQLSSGSPGSLETSSEYFTGEEMPSESSTGRKISPATFTSREISSASLTSGEISSASLTDGEISSASLTSGEISSTCGEIPSSSFTSGEMSPALSSKRKNRKKTLKTARLTRSANRSPLQPELGRTRSRSNKTGKQKGPMATEQLLPPGISVKTAVCDASDRRTGRSKGNSSPKPTSTETSKAELDTKLMEAMSAFSFLFHPVNTPRRPEGKGYWSKPQPTASSIGIPRKTEVGVAKADTKGNTGIDPKAKAVGTLAVRSSISEETEEKQTSQSSMVPRATKPTSSCESPVNQTRRFRSPGPTTYPLSEEKPGCQANQGSKTRFPSRTPSENDKTATNFSRERITEAMKAFLGKSPLTDFKKAADSNDNRLRASEDDQNPTAPAVSSSKPETAPRKVTALKDVLRNIEDLGGAACKFISKFVPGRASTTEAKACNPDSATSFQTKSFQTEYVASKSQAEMDIDRAEIGLDGDWVLL